MHPSNATVATPRRPRTPAAPDGEPRDPALPTPTRPATTPSSSPSTPRTTTPRTDDAEDDAAGEDLLVREGDVAGDYLERLLDILDVDGDIDLDVEGDRASVAIVGGQLRR